MADETRKYLDISGVQTLWNKVKALIPTKTSDLTNDSGFITSANIPTKTSDLTNDSNFISDASYVHTDVNFTSSLKTKLDGIASGAEVNVQADWSQTTTTADDYIKNKPTIPSKTSQLTNDSNYLVNASGSDYVGKWGGYEIQVSTNNTTDTWVPVFRGSILQHRVIPTAFNNYSAATGASALSSNNQDNLQFIHVVRIGNFVNVSFQFANSTAKTGSATWVALKAGFRPSRTVFGTCTCVGSNINQSAMRMYIYNDGTMMQYLDSGTTVTQCFGSIGFLIT